MIDGGYEIREFKDLDDVWEVIDILIDEVHEMNDGSTKFDLVSSIVAQLPFFTCPNHFNTIQLQRDIERYLYCEQNNVAPYKGTYGEQPARWVDRYFAIKNAYAKKESILIKQSRDKAKRG